MKRNHIMVGVLLVIAAGNAWDALVDGELPRFNLTISAVAIVLAIIVAVSRYEFPVRPERPKEEARARRRLGVSLMVSGSLASVLWIAFAPWEPAADFDVAGFLFLLQNFGRIVVLGMFASVACVGLALSSTA